MRNCFFAALFGAAIVAVFPPSAETDLEKHIHATLAENGAGKAMHQALTMKAPPDAAKLTKVSLQGTATALPTALAPETLQTVHFVVEDLREVDVPFTMSILCWARWN